MPLPTPKRSVLVILETLLGFESQEEREAWIRENLHDLPDLEREIRNLLSEGGSTGVLDDLVPTMEQLGEYLRDLRGEEIGPYVLLELLGCGGMGDVYLAHQHSPIKRLVAVKVLHGDLGEQVEIKRFQREQQVLARLQHPNIAHIYDAGKVESGYSFIAMEYVEGLQFHQYCQQNALPIQERIELFLQCCWAIEHAHQKGIIHRDIKPSNVLVNKVNQVASIKVIDFGIAKAQWSDSYSEETIRNLGERELRGEYLTEGGRSPGTPPFMSPEQGSLDPHLVDTRSDVYSLGALLYTLLTDSEPYHWETRDGKSVEEFIKTVTTTSLELPSERSVAWASQLRGDLDAIVSKAMAIDPQGRYQSVSELIEDLKCYQEHLPIRALMASPWRRTMKFVRRNRIALGAGGLAISSLLIALIFSIYHWMRAKESEQIATQSRVGSDLLAGSLGFRQGNYLLARDQLAKNANDSLVWTGGGKEPVHRLDWRLLQSLQPSSSQLVEKMDGKIYFGLSIPERGELVAADNRSRILFLDAVSPGVRRLEISAEQGDINGLALSPDHRLVASAGDDGSVKFWDVETGRLQRTLAVGSEHVFQCKWSADGKFFCTAGDGPDLLVWSVPEYELIHKFPSGGVDLECMDVGPQGQVVYGAASGVVRIGSLDAMEQPPEEMGLTSFRVLTVNRCSTVCFSPSGNLLGVGLDNGFLVLLRRGAEGYRPVERVRFPTDVTALAFGNEETSLAIGEKSGALHVLPLTAGWPSTSRLSFRSSYVKEFSKQISKNREELPSLWDYVVDATSGATRESVSPELDRVELKLSDSSLPQLYLSDTYLRQWYDEDGNTRADWGEFPESVQLIEGGVVLHFSSPFVAWKDSKVLREKQILRSWKPHEKRISGVFWGEGGMSLNTVSEDSSIRRQDLRVSDSGLVKQSNVDRFLAMQNQKVMIIGASDENYLLRMSDSPGTRESIHDFGVGKLALLFRDPMHPELVYGIQNRFRTTMEVENVIFRIDCENYQVQEVDIPKQQGILKHCMGVLDRDRLLLYYGASSASELASICCLDMAQKRFEWQIEILGEKIYNKPGSDCGRYVSFVIENVLYWVDAEKRTLTQAAAVEGATLEACAFSPDSQFIVASWSDQTLRCYRVVDGELAWGMNVSGQVVRDLDWSKDGRILVTVSWDGMVRTYDMQLQQITTELLLFESDKELNYVSLSPEEDWLYVGSRKANLYRIPCKWPR